MPCQPLSMTTIWVGFWFWVFEFEAGLLDQQSYECASIWGNICSVSWWEEKYAKTKGKLWGIQTATKRRGHKSEANVSSGRQIFQHKKKKQKKIDKNAWNVLLTLSAFSNPIIYLITLFRGDCWRKRTNCHCKLQLHLVDKSEIRNVANLNKSNDDPAGQSIVECSTIFDLGAFLSLNFQVVKDKQHKHLASMHWSCFRINEAII